MQIVMLICYTELPLIILIISLLSQIEYRSICVATYSLLIMELKGRGNDFVEWSTLQA